jgi:hypothetical protein
MMSFLNMSGAATDLTVLNPEHEDFDEAKRLDRFKICGVEYLRSDSPAGLSESRVKKSSIWRFGEKLIRVRDRKEVYYCYQCERQKRKQLLPKLSGNTGAHQHLLRHHNIDGDGRPKSHPPAGQPGIDENTFTLVSVAKKSEFQRLLIRWLVYCHICISMVENGCFRDLVAYLNKRLAALLPSAQATIRKWIMNAHREEKEKIKEEMRTSIGGIHISFDMWTSPNYLAMLSVFAHYLDKGAVDPMQYWLERRFQFPNLSKLAFDTLAIPPMADDNERSFSSARDLISYRRNRLKEDIVEASECFHNWYGRPEANAGLVSGNRVWGNEETGITTEDM